jgi:hypothetical protein
VSAAALNHVPAENIGELRQTHHIHLQHVCYLLATAGRGSYSTAPAEEGSQNGSMVGLWLVTFERDGEVWDVGFDQRHRDGTDLNT